MTSINVKDQLFSDDEVKACLRKLNIQASDACVQRMKFGEYSDLFSNIKLENDVYRDGKIKLTKSASGIQVNFQFSKQEIEFPKKILDHNLTDDEKGKLLQGNVIKIPAHNLYLKLDRETNSITVSTGKEIGVLNEIGKYKLTDTDKELLANGKTMPSRVFEGPDGFFMASVCISSDKRGLEFTNIKNISREEAKELIPKLNSTETSEKINLGNVAAVAGGSILSSGENLKDTALNKPETGNSQDESRIPGEKTRLLITDKYTGTADNEQKLFYISENINGEKFITFDLYPVEQEPKTIWTKISDADVKILASVFNRSEIDNNNQYRSFTSDQFEGAFTMKDIVKDSSSTLHLRSEFGKAVEAKDFSKVEEMADKGLITPVMIADIDSSAKLNEKEKFAMKAVAEKGIVLQPKQESTLKIQPFSSPKNNNSELSI
jgi:hypothetical protein